MRGGLTFTAWTHGLQFFNPFGYVDKTAHHGKQLIPVKLLVYLQNHGDFAQLIGGGNVVSPRVAESYSIASGKLS